MSTPDLGLQQGPRPGGSHHPRERLLAALFAAALATSLAVFAALAMSGGRGPTGTPSSGPVLVAELPTPAERSVGAFVQVFDRTWTVETENVDDWTYAPMSGSFQMSTLVHTRWNPGDGGVRSHVRLRSDVDLAGDFEVRTAIHWASEGRGTTHHAVVRLLAADGEEIAGVGHWDAWALQTGERWARAGSEVWGSGYGTQPAHDTAVVSIHREGERLQVVWGGSVVLEGDAPTRVASIVLDCGYYSFEGRSEERLLGEIRYSDFQVESW